MNRAQLLAELAEVGNQPGQVVFVERSGEDCRWPLDQPYPPGH